MRRPASRWCFLPGLVLMSCSSTGDSDGQPSPSAASSAHASPATPDFGAYEAATTSDELASLIREDLKRHMSRHAYEGIEAFAFTSMEEGRSTHADLVLQGTEPVFLFQRYGGQAYLTSVKTLGRLLRRDATQELEDVYSALEQGDMSSIAQARRTSRAVLHEETVRLSPALLPHAHFFDGVLGFAELEKNPEADLDDAKLVVDSMERASGPFAETGLEEPLFLALVISAQALERVGETELAVEKWLLAAESDFWPQAHHDLRVAIQGRIQSYRDALRGEVEQEVQGEWEARVAKIEASAQVQVDAANARVASLEGDLAAARERLINLEQVLAEERAEAERERERAATREHIRELEGRLEEAQRALDVVASNGPETTGLDLQDLANGSTMLTNVLSLWQIWRGQQPSP